MHIYRTNINNIGNPDIGPNKNVFTITGINIAINHIALSFPIKDFIRRLTSKLK